MSSLQRVTFSFSVAITLFSTIHSASAGQIDGNLYSDQESALVACDAAASAQNAKNPPADGGPGVHCKFFPSPVQGSSECQNLKSTGEYAEEIENESASLGYFFWCVPAYDPHKNNGDPGGCCSAGDPINLAVKNMRNSRSARSVLIYLS